MKIHIVHNDRHAIAHVIVRDWIYEGLLYPVSKCIHRDGRISFEYQSSTNSLDYFEEVNDECKLYFRFNFMWRGVWEGRIYFPNDEEFFSEELEEMNLLWNCLVEQMKSDIRKANPDWFKHENHEQGT